MLKFKPAVSKTGPLPVEVVDNAYDRMFKSMKKRERSKKFKAFLLFFLVGLLSGLVYLAQKGNREWILELLK